MKITIDKQIWQFLGQLATELLHGADGRLNDLPYLVLAEFYANNLEAFTYPCDRKRKMSPSQVLAIRTVLQEETFRGDPLWDTMLVVARDRFRQIAPENYNQTTKLIG